MALNGSDEEVIAVRRAEVGRLRCRRLTIREIRAELQRLGMVNPDTGEAWSIGTIHGDLEALVAEWKATAARETAAHRAELLGEVDEVKRAAWIAGDLRVVLAGIEAQRELLGLDEPDRVSIEDLRQMSEGDLTALARKRGVL